MAALEASLERGRRTRTRRAEGSRRSWPETSRRATREKLLTAGAYGDRSRRIAERSVRCSAASVADLEEYRAKRHKGKTPEPLDGDA